MGLSLPNGSRYFCKLNSSGLQKIYGLSGLQRCKLTHKAIKLGETRDVDVILVHARSREDKFVAEGYGVNRRDVMYNDFVMLGPKNDPAGITRICDAATGMAKIAAAQAIFVSRGDDSGPHAREKQLWKKAGVTPVGDWYLEAGRGMSEVMTMANERQGYTRAIVVPTSPIETRLISKSSWKEIRGSLTPTG